MNLNRLIKERLKKIENGCQTLKDVFEIIHEDESLIFCETTTGYKINKTTYGECKNKCLIMGNYFNEILKDIKKHSFVGLMMENRLEFITSFFGLLMAGYKPVLLNIRLGKKLNDEIIQRLNIKKVICDYNYDINANLINIIDFDYSKVLVVSDCFDWENELALSTSATSLNVKICIYDGESIICQLKNTKQLLKKNPMMKKQYQGSIKQLAFLPFYHIFGLMATYFWFSFFGQTFVFLKDLSSETILNQIKKHKVTHIFAVPLLWHIVYKSLMKEIKSKDELTKKKFYKGLKLSNKLQSIHPKFGMFVAKKIFKEVRSKLFGDSISFMISGGSYISKDAIYTLNGLGYPLFNGYGMSEIGITSVELSKKADIRNLASIGSPFEKVEYKINELGFLCVKSRGICKRIITKDDDITIDKNEYFNTFDLANVDKKNRYFILGRSDDVVLTDNGEKINPDLIEKELQLPSVERFVVMGLNNEGKDELALIIEVKPTINKIRINKITTEVLENLNKLKTKNYYIDKVYFTNSEIASKAAIKVSRKILKKWIDEGLVTLYPFNQLKEQKITDLNQMQIEISNQLKLIFGDILVSNSDIDINGHFILDLGGTSLDYLTLLVKLEEVYEIKFNENNECCYSILEFTNYIIKRLK